MTKEEFESLINRYLSGEASGREEQIVEDFFTAQERKEPADLHTLSDSMWAAIEDRIHDKALVVRQNVIGNGKTNTRKRFWRGISIVVTLLIAFFYGYYQGIFNTETTSQPWIVLDTPKGQKSIVTLADGTRIFLNGGSSISYPEVFQPEKREVRLSGEAFFEVTPNPERPFIVTSRAVTTKVLGTSFNVRAFSEKDISVTVASGSVRVEVESAMSPSGSGHANAVTLQPNSQAIYNAGHREFTVREVNIEKQLAWKDNTLFFEDTSIEEVAAILERWYNVDIVFDNELIRSCRINGKYKDQSLESVIKSIQYMYHIDFVFVLPNQIHLKGKGCKIQAAAFNSS